VVRPPSQIPRTLDAAIVADGPHGCSGIATAARRHTGGQVLVIAVGCGDAAALLAGGDSGAADGLAGPRPSMRDGEAAATPASDRRRTGHTATIRDISAVQDPGGRRPFRNVHRTLLGSDNPHLTSRLRTSAGLQCACGRPAADTHDRRGATVPRNR
jgi:hypothetical protein